MRKNRPSPINKVVKDFEFGKAERKRGIGASSPTDFHADTCYQCVKLSRTQSTRLGSNFEVASEES
jgi:hypothetical protein